MNKKLKIEITEVKEELYKKVKEYVEMGKNPKLYNSSKSLINKLPKLLTSFESGVIFLPENKPKGIKNPISPVHKQELLNIYKFIKKTFEEGIDALKKNTQNGFSSEISLDDIIYKINVGALGGSSKLYRGASIGHTLDLKEIKKRQFLQTKDLPVGLRGPFPSLDYYDNRRDQGGQYSLKYGKF